MKKERIQAKVNALVLNEGQLPWLPENPRQWTREDLELTKASLLRDPDFQEDNPLKVVALPDGKLLVFAGNLRTSAAREVKWKTFEAILYTPEGETDEETIRRRALLDNGSFGSWDYDRLADKWSEMPFKELGIKVWDELDAKPATPSAPVTEDDFDPDDGIVVRCQRGDVWELGDHRLMCGDSIDLQQVKTLMGGSEMDLLMTDPPYGISADKMTMGTGQQNYTRGEWDSARPDIIPLLNYAPLSCIWGGNYFADVLPVNNDWLCWHKNNDGLSFSEFELAWTNFGRNCRHLTHHWGNEKKLHITMKPVPVIAWAIQQTKTDCHNILDLFGGSGTTIIAAEQLGRRCFTMEIDPHFCDVIISRWEQFTGKTARKIE